MEGVFFIFTFYSPILSGVLLFGGITIKRAFRVIMLPGR